MDMLQRPGVTHLVACTSYAALTMTNDETRVRLRISATRHGQYLTAGPDTLTLEFDYDSRHCGRASHLLGTAAQDPEPGVVPIALGGAVLFIDPSLHIDLGAALLVLQVEQDLGPLMDLYRPDSTPVY